VCFYSTVKPRTLVGATFLKFLEGNIKQASKLLELYFGLEMLLMENL
jgi:hypothetical protein